MTLNTFSTDEIESFTHDTTDLPHEHRKAPTPEQRPAAPGSDGVKAFMMEFAASTGETETVPSATRDFLKAASFLFRK
ncbi:MAG: hypothetical protein ABI705_00125 [Aestuariivirga sp.]